MTPEQAKARMKMRAAAARNKSSPSQEVAEPTPEPASLPLSVVAPREGLSQLEDIGVGIVSGINRGVAAIPGIPGTIQQLLQMPSRETDLGNLMKSLPQLPTAEDTIAAWEGFAGELPEPETIAGRYAQAGAEFLPGGVGSIPRKLATAGLLGGATQAGQDIGGAPGAAVGLGAGLLAGKATGLTRAPSLLGEAAKVKNVPGTVKEAKTLKDAAYTTVKQDKTLFDPDAFNARILDGFRELREEGRTIRNTPSLKKFAREHGALPNDQVRAMTAEAARQKANKWSSSSSIDKARVGTVMRDKMDRFIANEVLAVRPDLASAIMEGRLNTRSYKLGKDIEKIIEKGENAENVETSLRTRLNTYKTNKKEMLPPEVNQAIDEFLHKSTGHRLLKGTASVLRNPLMPVAGAFSGNLVGLGTGLGAKLLGSGIKMRQEANVIDKANLIKKIALMQPQQRAELLRALQAARAGNKQSQTESILLGLGAPLEE